MKIVSSPKMTPIQVFPRPLRPQESTGPSGNALPRLLKTPSGLALLEMQGDINLPAQDDEDAISSESQDGVKSQETPIGRLVFPGYDPEDEANKTWMERVYLYVGKHQRLTGEVKKLPKAIVIIRKRRDEVVGQGDGDGDAMEENGEGKVEQLEIVDIVKYKILFSLRPEPVGATVPGAVAE